MLDDLADVHEFLYNFPFYKIQNLMFAPKCQSATLDEYNCAVSELKEYCLLFVNSRPKGAAANRYSKIPPWIYRSANEYVIANLNPCLARAIFIMKHCDIRDTDTSAIVDYYCKEKKILTPYTMNRLLSEVVTGTIDMAYGYDEEIFFFNKPLEVIFPQSPETSSLMSDSFQEAFNERIGIDLDYDGDDSNIYIRLGSHSTKEDVLWFVEKYWDEMLKYMPVSASNEWRVLDDTEKEIQHLITKCLIACNIAPKDIVSIIDKNFENNDAVQPKSISTQKTRLLEELANDPFHSIYQTLVKSDYSKAFDADVKITNLAKKQKPFLLVKNKEPLELDITNKMPQRLKEVLELMKDWE